MRWRADLEFRGIAQAMVGDVEAAAETIEIFTRMWMVYGGLPEVFNLYNQRMTSPVSETTMRCTSMSG